MIEHVSLRCRNSRRSRTFYQRALAPLGYVQDLVHGDSFGFMQGGRHDFWVTPGKVATPAHLAFLAGSRSAVDAFHAAAVAEGGKDNGAPGYREDYGYAAFVLDLDGHNIEAVIWIKKRAAKPAQRKKATPAKKTSTKKTSTK